MEIMVRELRPQDKQRSLWIEAGALPSVSYVNDVWESFTSEKDGFFLGAWFNGQLCGIGKITSLYGNYGWLETLRVHPLYQGKGLGKALYEEFMVKMRQLGFNALGMYTELYNKRSAGLAQKYGFGFKGQYTEVAKQLQRADMIAETSFLPVDAAKGEEVLSPLYKSMGEFIVINRTFFPVKKGLGAFLAAQGWLFCDDEKNIAIAGARFQASKCLHLAFFAGDTKKVMDFACGQARRCNSAKISAVREHGRIKKQTALFEEYGFKPVEDIVTMWKNL